MVTKSPGRNLSRIDPDSYEYERVNRSWRRECKHCRTLVRLALMLLVLITGIGVSPAQAQVVADTLVLHRMILYDQGQEAVTLLAEEALARGNWAPAAGDEVVFVSEMVDFLMARTVAIDVEPDNCNLPRSIQTRNLEPPNPDCGRNFQHHQNLIQFGAATFVSAIGDGIFVPRPLDDILSVYIEEVSHSWQEYCYETEGRCAGERSRHTTWGEGRRLESGWEYQAKKYILNLDGVVLDLSDGERAELTWHICEGYAYPMYSEVLPYGPPEGWVHPQGWPLHTPTAAEFNTFCSSQT